MSAPESWPPHGTTSPGTSAYGPSPYGPPASAPAVRRSPLAVVAFVAGVATVLVGAAFTLAFPLFLSSPGYSASSFAVLQLVDGVVTAVVGLAAVIAGAVVLVRRAPGTALAAAGTALGAAALLGVVLVVVQSLLYQVL
jgi:hypothetical protein